MRLAPRLRTWLISLIVIVIAGVWQSSAIAKEPEKEVQVAMCTGTFITNDGYILTAAHCKAGAGIILYRETNSDKVQVKPYTVIAYDTKTDLMLLKVETSGQASLPIADRADRFESTFSVGFPDIDTYGKNLKIYPGHVEGHGQTDFMKTNIIINSLLFQGMSGGPTINKYGEIVAVNTAGLFDKEHLNRDKMSTLTLGVDYELIKEFLNKTSVSFETDPVSKDLYQAVVLIVSEVEEEHV